MLTQHQEILYQLLIEMADICTEHNISYGIGSDTLLGAISINSMLPESHTISVYMKSNDYYKFIEICSKKCERTNHRFLDCRETNEFCTNSFARYVNTKTTLIDKHNLITGDKAGIGVDIYCLDNVRNHKNDANHYYKKLRLYCDFLNNSKNYSIPYEDNKFSYLFNKAKGKVVSKESILQSLESNLEKFNNYNCNFYMVREPSLPVCIPKRIVGSFNSIVTIAGRKFRTFENPYSYLSIIYGEEWMYQNSPKNTDDTLILNQKTTYENIKSELYNFIDKDELDKKYNSKKNFDFLTEKQGLKVQDFRSKIELIGKSLEDHNFLRSKNDEIEKAIEEENYNKLSEIFSEYIKNQSSKKLIGSKDLDNIYRYHHPLLIKIDPEYYEAVVLTLFHTSRIDKAKRFIQVYSYHFKKTIVMKVVEENIFHYKKALVLIDENKFDRAITLLDKLLKKYPKNISFIKLKVYCLLRSFFADDHTVEIKGLINLGLEMFPNDGDLLKYQNELLINDDLEKAILGYIDAYFKTDNIITKREIRYTLDKHLDTLIKDTHNIDFLDRLLLILNDDFRLYNKKFQLMNNEIEQTEGRERKAKKQYDFVYYLVNLRYKYKEKFAQNIFSKTERTISQWYHNIVKGICKNEFITCVSAEIINCTDFNKLSMILDNIDSHMVNIDIGDINYLYCLILKSHVLRKIGEFQKSSKILIQVAKENKDPYLTIVIKKDFLGEINCIYRELTSSIEHIYDSSFDSKISAKKINEKEKSDEKSVYDFYTDRIKGIYPSVLNFLEIITKVGLITIQQRNDFVKDLSIDGSSTFNKEIAETLYKLTGQIQI